MSRKSAATFLRFQFQISEKWEKAIILASAIQNILCMMHIHENPDYRWSFALLEFLCIMVFLADVLLKASYQGPMVYCEDLTNL